jgi:hypothetical protein
MTEAEWLASSNIDRLLNWLADKTSDRRLRLFACACCRNIGDLFHEGHHKVVEALEGFAEGRVNCEELVRTRELAREVMREQDMVWYYVSPPWYASRTEGPNASLVAARDAARASRSWRARSSSAEQGARPERQVPLLRDVFGNPFRPVDVDPAWLTWNGSTVVQLARAIYDDRRFEDLPILADALEEAGCTDAALLDHCRQPGEHVPGCWVLDLLLGKA